MELMDGTVLRASIEDTRHCRRRRLREFTMTAVGGRFGVAL
eukprot:gene6452-3141_t